MTLQEFISLRKKLNLTQGELAHILGMKLRGIQDIEGGRTPLRTIHILAIERVSEKEAAVARDATLLADGVYPDIHRIVYGVPPS
ncbi:helix-turn-helix transcriptional regulator [Aureimonas sp. AU22]|jgi:DNA-binding transcriptional regulator YiaG|uniref:helix-turn-helix domain-containing protein n=1 Tax=Aureimonas sp. AU22 TaxID=1638162 RepID=UPI0007819170|nr:helix-turn-helix transcriptional regulator [Aureimonas sp. AU22]